MLWWLQRKGIAFVTRQKKSYKIWFKNQTKHLFSFQRTKSSEPDCKNWPFFCRSKKGQHGGSFFAARYVVRFAIQIVFSLAKNQTLVAARGMTSICHTTKKSSFKIGLKNKMYNFKIHSRSEFAELSLAEKIGHFFVDKKKAIIVGGCSFTPRSYPRKPVFA